RTSKRRKALRTGAAIMRRRPRPSPPPSPPGPPSARVGLAEAKARQQAPPPVGDRTGGLGEAHHRRVPLAARRVGAQPLALDHDALVELGHLVARPRRERAG